MAKRTQVNKALAVERTGTDLEDFLKQLPIEVRTKSAKKAVRAGGNEVAKAARRNIKRGGPREGRKSGKPHLKNTVRVRVRDYGGRFLAVVGTSWPSGAHGHLVEFGYYAKARDGTTTWVPPQPYLRPAADTTKNQQAAAITDSLKKTIFKETGASSGPEAGAFF